MEITDKIKPCPFCGGTDIEYYETDFGRADEPYSYIIRCNGCNANVYAESGEYEDAITLWNKRTYESEEK